MTAGADDEQARKDARWAAYQARSKRSAQKFQLGMVGFWAVFAAVGWFLGHDTVGHWIWTAQAVVQIGVGVVLWRQIRKPLPPCPGTEEAPGR